MDMGLRCQIVDFKAIGRRKICQGRPNGRRIAEIGLPKFKPRMGEKVLDPLTIGRGTPADHPDDVVLLFEKKLCEIGSILPGDPGDDSDPVH
jgi:hypothetical protein